MIYAKVLTVSDGVTQGTREDLSGLALVEFLKQADFEVVEHRTTPDGLNSVASALIEMSHLFNGVIITTGGTGFSIRDTTPEATKIVIEREAPGFSEYMRSINRLGILSRGLSGIRGVTLILNTVGSPKGCVEMLSSVLEYIPHAVSLLADAHDPHPKNP